MNHFIAAVTTLQSQVDPTTGVKIAAQVSIVVLGIAAPSKNSDGSYTFTITVAFIPSDASITVTVDHERLFCPALKGLVYDMTKVQPTTDCVYTTRVGSVKRAIAQQSQTYDMTTTAPGPSVDAIYGSSASTVAVAFGASLVSLFVALLF